MKIYNYLLNFLPRVSSFIKNSSDISYNDNFSINGVKKEIIAVSNLDIKSQPARLGVKLEFTDSVTQAQHMKLNSNLLKIKNILETSNAENEYDLDVFTLKADIFKLAYMHKGTGTLLNVIDPATSYVDSMKKYYKHSNPVFRDKIDQIVEEINNFNYPAHLFKSPVLLPFYPDPDSKRSSPGIIIQNKAKYVLDGLSNFLNIKASSPSVRGTKTDFILSNNVFTSNLDFKFFSPVIYKSINNYMFVYNQVVDTSTLSRFIDIKRLLNLISVSFEKTNYPEGRSIILTLDIFPNAHELLEYNLLQKELNDFYLPFLRQHGYSVPKNSSVYFLFVGSPPSNDNLYSDVEKILISNSSIFVDKFGISPKNLEDIIISIRK